MATAGSESSVGGQGTNKYKTKIGSPLCRHTTRISQVARGGSYKWKCNVCDNKPFNSSYSRVKLHFMGLANKGMGICKGKDKKGMFAAQIVGYVKEHEEVDRLVRRSNQTSYGGPSRKKKMQLPTELVASSKHPFLLVPEVEEEEVEITTHKRGPLDTPFKMEARELADQAIGRCLYTNGFPFNLVRSPYWKDMVAAINSARAGYKSPGHEKVCTTILQKERTSIKGSL